MSLYAQMWAIVVAWAVCGLLIARVTIRSRAGSVGLPLAYVFAMSFLHLGVIAYLNPDYTHDRYDANPYLFSLDYTAEMVRDGALASLLTLAGMLLACLLFRGGAAPRVAPPIATPPDRTPLLVNLMALSAIGFVGGFFVIASVQSIFVALRGLAAVIVCLGLWIALRREDRVQFTRWLAVAGAIPVIYLIFYGFFSYAFIALSIVFAFWLSVPKVRPPRALKTGAISALVLYVVLSGFVSWMNVREGLRSVIWSDYMRAEGQAGSTLAERFDALIKASDGFEFFNPWSFSQLDWFNVRLNQNIFIGKAMAWHQIHPGLDLNGQSMLLALVGWVPRFMWPSKPEMGGSHFVAEHTGMLFSREIAVASGPTFEFVINLGLVGSALGGFMFGVLLRLLDRGASRALRKMDYALFITLFLIGIAFVSPSSQLFFIVGTAAASLVTGFAIRFWMNAAAQARAEATAVLRP